MRVKDVELSTKKVDGCRRMSLFPCSIGGWSLGKLLGEGASGSVFHATKDGEVGALKVVTHWQRPKNAKKRDFDTKRVLLGMESTQLSRMLDARIRNPFLPRLIQKFSTEGNRSFVVFELFQRGSLADWFKCGGAISPRGAYGIGFRLVKALQLMHESDVGWLHLDVKPGNVMLTDDPRRVVCLVDFGLTVPIPYTLLEPRTEVQGSYGFMGTHVWNKERQSRRDDLEAAGLTLAWLLLGGDLPWINQEPSEMRQQIQDEKMPRRLACKCKAPALQTYLERVRSLEVDEVPPYKELLAILGEAAGPCADLITPGNMPCASLQPPEAPAQARPRRRKIPRVETAIESEGRVNKAQKRVVMVS